MCGGRFSILHYGPLIETNYMYAPTPNGQNLSASLNKSNAPRLKADLHFDNVMTHITRSGEILKMYTCPRTTDCKKALVRTKALLARTQIKTKAIFVNIMIY